MAHVIPFAESRWTNSPLRFHRGSPQSSSAELPGPVLLWGTGYPGGARAEYERPALDREIELIRSIIPFFTDEDREKILGRNAARLWGFV